MTSGRRTAEPYDSAEAAQLQRDIVSSVVHDLGSITSAFALLIDASRGAFGERDVQAVTTLTEQLRATTKPLIWLRGSPGRGALAPVHAVEVATWWRHTSQVVAALLPRGTRVAPSADDIPTTGNALPGEDLAIFTMLILGACRHIGENDPHAAVALSVTLPSVESDSPTVMLELRADDIDSAPSVTRTTRWKRFCVRTAARAGATLSWWEPVGSPCVVWQWSVSGKPVRG